MYALDKFEENGSCGSENTSPAPKPWPKGDFRKKEAIVT